MTTTPPTPATPRVLLICTANVCRSPMAEGLLRSRLERRGVEAEVSSAGTDAHPVITVSRRAVRAAAELGAGIEGHHPRQLVPAMLATEGADLIVAMCGEHLRSVVLLDHDAAPRAFTLRELVRLASGEGPRADGTSLTEWISALDRGRSPSDLIAAAASDDIDDPFGRSMRKHRRTAAEIDELLGEFVARAWPVT